ncbi:MAG: F0F1 ATP synthase subunit delta [Arenimonas sp.]
MSQYTTLARPYARAVFRMAREQQRLPQWSSMIGFAARAVAEPAVQSLLGNPSISAQALAGLVVPVGDVDPLFTQFLSVLAENRRLAVLPEIAALFDSYRAEDEHIVKATITSASALSETELGKLRASLVKRFGREVQVSTAVDASLIGGAVIDAGDVVIDGSIRTKLARLGAALAN